MKNTIHRFRILLAAVFALGAVACHDAAVELQEAELGRLLRPSAVTARATAPGTIAVTWRGAADRFHVEWGLTADFSGESTPVEVIGNSCVVEGLEEATAYYFRVQGLSDRAGVAASEFSAVATARTITEPKIPNVAASSEMVYTLDPWSVTCTVTITWGAEGVEPEAVSSVRLTPAGGGDALTFPVSEAEAAAQSVACSAGILTDTEYAIELLVGRKVRGGCVHRTVPGPTPALYAEAELDFTTDPVTAAATLRWELYYVSPDDLAAVDLRRAGADAPELRVPVTPADRAAGFVRAAGLAPGTDYAADLLAADGRPVASAAFTTPEAPGEEVRIVRPGDDLAAIIADPDRTCERIYLVAGAYTLTAEAVIPITRSLELYADDPARTTIAVEKNFQPEGSLQQLIFRNLRLECATYLIQAKKAYEIALLRFEHCVVDLNVGAAGASTLFNSATTAAGADRATVEQYEVVDCVVFANAAQAQNIVYGSASNNNGTFGRIVMRNSTFSNCARGLIYVTNTAAGAYDVTLENCTLYDVASAGGNALIDIRMAGDNPDRRITLRNSVLWFGSTKGYKVLQLAGSIAKERIACENFYHFAAQPPAFGSSAYNIADRMTSYEGAPADLWQNPMADPTAAGASFRIKDPAVRAAQESAGTVLGDPRWEK